MRQVRFVRLGNHFQIQLLTIRFRFRTFQRSHRRSQLFLGQFVFQIHALIFRRLIGQRTLAATGNRFHLLRDFFTQALLTRNQTRNLRVFRRNSFYLVKLGLNNNQLVLQFGYQTHLHIRLCLQVENTVGHTEFCQLGRSFFNFLFSRIDHFLSITNRILTRTLVQLVDQYLTLFEQSIIDLLRFTGIERCNAQIGNA